ncbi:MAG: hypothetical protein PHY64_08520 [Eubacteriales bacterium]|nr:hypothetical protein [Eubacteriales bacterium]
MRITRITDQLVCILIGLCVCLLPWVPAAAQADPAESVRLICYSDEFPNDDVIFQHAVSVFQTKYPDVKLTVTVRDAPVSSFEEEAADIYLVHNNFGADTEQIDLSTFNTSEGFCNLNTLSQYSTWQSGLLPMDYLPDSSSENIAIPYTAVSTVLEVNEDIWAEYSLDEPLAQYPALWSDLVPIAEWMKNKPDYVLFEDCGEADLSILLYQLCAYVEDCRKNGTPVDARVVEDNLHTYRVLWEMNEVSRTPEDVKAVLFTQTAATYLSGDVVYTELPALSPEIRIVPSACVEIFVNSHVEDHPYALQLVDCLLSQESQSEYNLMGVIRNDISVEPGEDYEAFLPPTSANMAVYLSALQHGAVPELNLADKRSCMSIANQWLAGSLTDAQAAVQLTDLWEK